MRRDCDFEPKISEKFSDKSGKMRQARKGLGGSNLPCLSKHEVIGDKQQSRFSGTPAPAFASLKLGFGVTKSAEDKRKRASRSSGVTQSAYDTRT